MDRFSSEIEDQVFSSGLRGYDRAEVDAFLTRCAHEMGDLEERFRLSEVRAANNETELADLKANIDSLLQEATDARRKIIEEAKLEAISIVEASSTTPVPSVERASPAESETALLLERAKAEQQAALEEAESITSLAKADAAKTRADADSLLDSARADAYTIRAEAQALRADIESHMAEIQELLAMARVLDEPPPPQRNGDMPGASDDVIDLRDGVVSPDSSSTVG